jgi:cold shock protein
MSGDTELRTRGKTYQAEGKIQNTLSELKDSQREDGRNNSWPPWRGNPACDMLGRSASVARRCQAGAWPLNQTRQDDLAKAHWRDSGLKEYSMATGTVKWYNETKGYGFIQPDNGGKDVFVHATALERAGMRGLAEGQKISYEVEADRRTGKESATNLQKAWLSLSFGQFDAHPQASPQERLEVLTGFRNRVPDGQSVTCFWRLA